MINVPTMDQLSILPRLSETEHLHPEEKIVHLHFTANQCHWWAIEWDGQDTFFGFIMIDGGRQLAKFSYFRLSDLLAIKVEGWLEVLNDPFWIPRAMKEIVLARETIHSQSAQSRQVP